MCCGLDWPSLAESGMNALEWSPTVGGRLLNRKNDRQLKGSVEDTRENHPQDEAVFRPTIFREGKPLRLSFHTFPPC